MIGKGAGGGWFFAVLTAAAALTSGCMAPVDVGDLPGLYRNDATGGEILLKTDGTFSASDVSGDEVTGNGATDRVDFSGRWEFIDNSSASDFIYLTVDDGGLGKVGGIQLYTSGRAAVKFRADPDGPPSLVLTRVSAA
ncbi:hypothetical protein ACSNOI_01745 [Actinomadura kijaniata]|uniref:hypothetical protein n=1 Tax=Actinomadura kijaniata TaxID=46161 RepID=UPI003F19B62C